MKRNLIITGLLICFCILSLGIEISAAINPEEFKNNSPENIVLRVTASSIEKHPGMTKIYLTAEIVKVIKTETGLKSGDSLLVLYEQNHAKREADDEKLNKHAENGWCGPQVLYYPSVLISGDVRVAYLKKNISDNTTGKVYSPDAWQYSFEDINKK